MIENQPEIALLEQFQQQITPPYPLLSVPEYRVGQHGEWKLEQLEPSVFIRSYFTRVQLQKSTNYRLCKGKAVWMSLTPMERESLAHHATNAYGHTVVMGLGMGLLLYNIITRDEVTKVTVVESDRYIVELLYQITDSTSWTGWEKVNIVIADALTWQPDEPVDFLSVDIWQKLGDMNQRPDAQQIQGNVKAKLVALWGQELDFITFLTHQGYEPPATLAHYHEYIEVIGIPLIEADNPEYPEYCMWAGEIAIS